MEKGFYLIISLLLFALEPLFAQRVNERYPVLSYWDFKYRGTADSVDCRYNPVNNKLFLSGFDTDGKGTFYFAGGCPLRVSCFKGTTLQWRRKVSDTYTTRGLFRLRGDSLYLVHDRTHELIIMSKDGKGEVRHVKLATNDIYEGVMHDNYFVIRGEKTTDSTKTYDWENYKLSFFNYQGRLAWTDVTDLLYSDNMMRPMPKTPHIDEYSTDFIRYAGLFRDMHLFVDLAAERFFLFDLNGKKIYRMIEGDLLYDVLPLSAFTDEIDKEIFFSSQESYILRGTHYYYAGYEKADNHFMVVDIDLDKIFPEAASWYKK